MGFTWTIVLLVVTLISTLKPVRAKRSSDEGTTADLLGGLRFVLHRRTVLGAISLDLFAVLFGGATALLPCASPQHPASTQIWIVFSSSRLKRRPMKNGAMDCSTAPKKFGRTPLQTKASARCQRIKSTSGSPG